MTAHESMRDIYCSYIILPFSYRQTTSVTGVTIVLNSHFCMQVSSSFYHTKYIINSSYTELLTNLIAYSNTKCSWKHHQYHY